MIRSRSSLIHHTTSVALVLGGVLTVQYLTSGEIQAQSFVRRTVTAGNNITGLEMAIEGPQRGIRGGRIQWQLAAQQVTGLSGLHVSPRTRIRVLCSLVRDRAMAEATTDDMGRVEIGFVIPEDAPDQFHVVFEAISTNNIRRQFDLDVNVSASRNLTLNIDRSQIRPGAQIHGWGQLTSRIDGHAIANAPVNVMLVDSSQRPVATRWTGTTDANGMYWHDFTLPRFDVSAYSMTVTHVSGTESFSAQRQVNATVPSVPVMIVRAMPEQSMVAPSQRVRVLISVRTPDGRPVADAIVRSGRMPRTLLTPRNEQPSVRTGLNGVAMFDFVAPSSAGPIDVPIDVHATRAGIGDANANTSVRVASARLFAAASVEGGYLTQGLPGKVYARVMRTDGSPASAGVTVRITGPRLGRGVTATTDADGVATLDVALANPAIARPRAARRPTTPAAEGDEEQTETPEEDLPLDNCGGTTSTAFSLAINEGPVQGSAEGCLGIEPDATIRPRVREGVVVAPNTDLHVTLSKLPNIARTPVQVALLARDGGSYAPLTAVVIAANATEATLHIPPDAHGMLIVRARPLWGELSQPVLGGSTAVWVQRGARVALSISEASESSVQVRLSNTNSMPMMFAVVPREDSASLLSQLSESDSTRVLGDLRVPFAQAGAAILSGAMFARMIRDEGVQGVLRGTRMIDLPAPSNPGEWGNLRDPYRSAARFIEGRLALIFQSIEQHVATKIRTARADVGQRVGGRWEFNREIFDALTQSADGADSSGGARNLGGGPLNIQDLQRLDSAFTFDNVARRLTRQRMFILLVGLRQFAAQRALDLRWSWRGDPTAWLRQMAANDGEFTIEDSSTGESRTIDADAMVDGWGNPFALRPAPGGRSRFGFLSPVAGFDLVSAGPDERMGTVDDIVDPFARVLPSGGAYARAMNEDGLVARLRGVELGRATIARLVGVFEASASYEEGEEEGASESIQAGPDWTAIPSKLVIDPFALSLLRPANSAASFVRVGASVTSETSVPVALDDEPRAWMAIAHGYDSNGTSVFNSRVFMAGKPVLITLPIAPQPNELRPTVARVRVGEPLVVTAMITNLSANDRQFAVVAEGEGAISVQAPSTLAIPAGQSAPVELRISASAAGAGAVRLSVREGQAVMRSVRAPLVADFGGLALRQDAMGLLQNGTLTLRETIPSNIRGATERLVLLAPSAIADDPELDRVRRTDPAIIAWAYTLAGRPLPQALADSLLHATDNYGQVNGDPRGRSSNAAQALSAACAVIAWAAADEDDTASHSALTRARSRFSAYAGAGFADTDATAGQLRLAAATIAALATGAPAMDGREGYDPLEAYIAQASARLHAVRDAYSAQPTILARAAAALLLLDPTDPRARAIYERAKRAVVDGGVRGSLVGAGEGRTRMEEVLAASAAMAIAAQQRGDMVLAQSLARGVALRGHLAMRAGGEVAFWLLANGAFGVLGLDSPQTAAITIDGARREVTLSDGRALVAIPSTPGLGAERTVLIETPNRLPLLARWELIYDASSVTRSDAPVTLRIVGDPGFAGERAALELTVQNNQNTALERLALELQLPAGTGLGAELLAAMRGAGNLTSVELRDGGLLTMVVGGIAANQSITIPLPLRWLSQGTISGLGTVAYLQDRPTRMTVLPPREIILRERPPVQAQSPAQAAATAAQEAANAAHFR